MARLYISATRQSSGKTAVSVGLTAAFAARGIIPQPFKKGPDYIDSMWLGRAAGRACINLDFHTMSTEEIRATFLRYAASSQIAVIEGTKGLFDGLAVDGSDSNAALAKQLGAQVVLVVDAKGMTRGIVPLLLGHLQFDTTIDVGGIILNNLGGTRHEAKLKAAISRYLDVPVLGAIPRDTRMQLTMRHLGLMPSNEADDADQRIADLQSCIETYVDIDALLAVARRAPAFEPPSNVSGNVTTNLKVRIGIAQDSAFGFYYPDDLIRLQEAGAELVTIDTLKDSTLPDIDALLIGGGFPETHLAALQANQTLRTAVRSALAAGLPCYAECGGLMYLARSITWNGDRFDMVGAIPGDIIMHDKPIGKGYTKLEETADHPWNPPGTATPLRVFNAHEFHYSEIKNLPEDTRYAFRMRRGVGIDGKNDGIVYNNLLACYCHLRDVGGNHWTSRFLAFVRQHASLSRPALAHASGNEYCRS